jgi:hypothetical protein
MFGLRRLLLLARSVPRKSKKKNAYYYQTGD